MHTKYNQWSKRILRNIRVVYNLSNESDRELGLIWYQDANRKAKELAEKYNLSIQGCAGTIAAISPGTRWERNLLEAEELIYAFKKGSDIPVVGVYGRRNVQKAIDILKGSDPLALLSAKTGKKTRNFYLNICNPMDDCPVTIDRHAKALAYNLSSGRTGSASDDKQSLVRMAEYDYLAKHYRRLAEEYKLIPNQLQAICWVCWKRTEGLKVQQEEVPF